MKKLLLASCFLFSLFSLAHVNTASAAAEEGFNPWACDNPPPWDPEAGAYRMVITGQREPGGAAGAGDANGDGTEDAVSVGVTGGEIGDMVDIQGPGGDGIDFEIIDLRTADHPGEAVLISGSGASGGSTVFAAAPMMTIIFTGSQSVNGELILQKVTQIGRIANLQMRYSAYLDLVRLMGQASVQGYPIANNIWSYVQSLMRAAEVLSRFGPQTGLVSLSLLSRATLLGTVLWGSIWAGTYIYNNSDWLQNGGLDDVFCALERVKYNSYVCP